MKWTVFCSALVREKRRKGVFMKIRIFAAVLAMLLLLPLSACGEEEGEPQDTKGSETVSDTASDTESSAAEEGEEEPEGPSATALEDFEYITDSQGGITLTAVKDKEIVFCKIPAGVTAIGSATFLDCTQLEKIEIPTDVRSIGLGAFNGCDKLIETEGSVSYVGAWAIDCTEEVTKATLRNGTVGIADSVFAGCEKMTEVTIPGSVKYIGTYAFSRCKALAAVTLPEGISSIGEYTFFECASLKSVAIPVGVVSIKDYALGNCKALKSITLPASVTSIGEGAFYNCTALISVSYGGDSASWKKIELGTGNGALTGAYGND
ncbi:MAG: leucine-rich repeat domain-containing protein [Ruminococcaceae bacterium]|nr:leucine-rich repeat domain-containing protein [Oscillospiraceae bacterium]